LFAKRKAEIEVRKAEKRASSQDLKTRLEAEELILDMPAGQNGKLFGAVSNATIADDLLKSGISIDRKKIDVPGRVIKSVGNYKVTIRLYEKVEAVVKIVVKGHIERPKNIPTAPDHHRKRRHEEHPIEALPTAKVETQPQAEAVAGSAAEAQN
jgi:large subunit ribosomal protein L9